jgi:hypothetical protein
MTHEPRGELQDAVDRFFRERGVSAGVRAKGLRGIIGDWDTIARGAEHYDLTLDDWLNDLDLRDIIAGAMAAAPETTIRDLRDALERADDAFRAATIEFKQSLWEVGIDGTRSTPRHDRVAQWWYFRYPRRPGFSMQRDLESAGIASPNRSGRKK